MDARLRSAVDASAGWYDTVFAVHGVASVLDRGLLRSVGPPPPLHSAVVVLEPDVSGGDVRAAVADGAARGVADCFATVDLSDGFDLLFSARWLHLPALRTRTAAPPGWSVVRDAAGLAEWHTDWDVDGPVVPALLDRGGCVVLVRHEDARPTAGAIAHLGPGTAYLSNVHGIGGAPVDWPDVVAAVRARLPGRDLLGYERGSDLTDALAAGFADVGEHRVWVR